MEMDRYVTTVGIVIIVVLIVGGYLLLETEREEGKRASLEDAEPGGGNYRP